MKRELDPTAFEQVCYAAEPSHARWLSGVFDAGRPLLSHGLGACFALVSWADGAPVLELAGNDGLCPELLAVQTAWLLRSDPHTLRALWYPKKPLIFASRLTPAGRPPAQQRAFFAQLARHGAHDVLAMCGHPDRGRAFVFAVPLPAPRALSREALHALSYARVQLQNALRLRLCPELAPVALLRAGEGPAPSLAWRALVEGRWGVIARVDDDAKRIYAAYEAAPDAPAYNALTTFEARLLEQAAQGLSGKHSAYALGVSQTRVSRGLASAAARLGFARVEDAVRLAARVLRTALPPEEPRAPLTSAEREVLRLVQKGWPNVRIASERRTSVHTIANQVAAILRKTGCATRRSLLSVELDPVELSAPPSAPR